MNKDIRCLETRQSRLIYSEDREKSWVSPILSMRNRPNNEGITFQYGKRKGSPKPYKHKDLHK